MAIQARMLVGIQAGDRFVSQEGGSFRLKASNRPFESSSASSDPVFEHRVIFSIDTGQPACVAIVFIAFTSAVHRPQRVL
jgi:hypothetical protein